MRKQRYFSREELSKLGVAFNVGDEDQLAEDFKRGQWYFEIAPRENVFRGPYPNKRAALSAWKAARAPR